ncbi:MAG: ABC transporter transmembrane domain-containing protein [Actinomycetes bacterium]
MTRRTSSPGGSPRHHQPSDLRRTVQLFRRFMGRPRVYLVATGLLLLEALTSIVEPFPIAFLVDFLQGSRPALRQLGWPRILSSERTETILLLSIAIIAIAAVNKAADSLAEVCLARGGRVLGYNVRTAMYAHLQRLSLAYHDNKRTGDVLTRVTGDVLVLEEFVVVSASNIIGSLMLLVGTFAVLFTQSWNVAVVALLAVPLLALVSNHYSRRIKAASKEQRSREGELASTAQEMLTSIRLVQSHGRGNVDMARFSDQTAKSMRTSLRAANIQAKFSFAIAIVEALAIVAVVWIGVWLVDRKAVTVGTLVLLILLLQNMFKPARKVVSEWYKVGKVLASAERIDDLLQRQPAVVDRPDAVAAPQLRGHLAFEDVRFAYPADREDSVPAAGRSRVLDGITFDVSPGEVVAIAGHSGAGKSTIAQLIPRLYDPDGGAVKIDGLDIRSLTLESLRDQVSLVLQDTVLLSGSVADNITYGLADVTDDRIRAAARAANALDFIEELPEGFGTVLGERGSTLSGGQRQRIAIARAFIRETPVIVLDEPTTGLDVESTRLVIAALRALMRSKTTVIISHDLSLIRCADRVLVLAEGRIIESGSHERLLARRGAYAELYASQFELHGEHVTAPAAPEAEPVTDRPTAHGTSLVTVPGNGDARVERTHRKPAAAEPGGNGGGSASSLRGRLPVLAGAADEEFVADQVERLLVRPGATVAAARAGSWWYRPDGSCQVRYDVLVIDEDGRSSEQTLLGRAHRDPHSAISYATDRLLPLAAQQRSGPPVPWRQWAAVVRPANLALHPFPLDPGLPTLAHLVDVQAMADVLDRDVPQAAADRGAAAWRVDVVHHPRQGPCVLRYRLGPDVAGPVTRHREVYGKAYPQGGSYSAAAALRSLQRAAGSASSPVRLPRPLAHCPELAVVLTEALPGLPRLPQALRTAFGPTNGEHVDRLPATRRLVAEIGTVLAALHRTPTQLLPSLPTRSLAEDMAELIWEYDVVEPVWPEVAHAVSRRLRHHAGLVGSSAAAAPVVCHGDFTPAQVLVGESGISLVDVDGACLGEPALDLGRFVAALEATAMKVGGGAAQPLIDDLVRSFLADYQHAGRTARAMDHRLLERVALARTTSLARSALRACRQLKDDRLERHLRLLDPEPASLIERWNA